MFEFRSKITLFGPDREKIKSEDITKGKGYQTLVDLPAGGRTLVALRGARSMSGSIWKHAGIGSEAQLYALVNDVVKAYLSHLPGPVKKSLLGYKDGKRRLDETIMAALDLNATENQIAIVEHDDRGRWEARASG